MTANLSGRQSNDSSDVAAIVTAMTDDEKYFLAETMQAVLSDPGIGQVILCVEEKNNWLNTLPVQHLNDSRVRVLHLPMMPIGGVRNRALDYVQKSWIAFCDGDDVWCKGKTVFQRTYADQHKTDLVGGGHYLMNEAGKTRAYGLSLHIPMLSSLMVRTAIMKELPFNEDLVMGSDGEWWIRNFNALRKGRCPKVLLRYRVRAVSVSSISSSKKRKLRIVRLAEIPVLGFGILFFTYCLWLCTKHRPYKWLDRWSTKPLR